MDREFFSLLYANSKSKETEIVVSDDVIDNIGFEDVKTIFKNTERYFDQHKLQLNKLLTDPNAIIYRQEILTDFLNNRELRDDIGKILPKINDVIREHNEYSACHRDPIRDVLWKIGVFEIFADSIEELSDLLARHSTNYTSRGLKLLHEWLMSIKDKPSYRAAKDILPTIREKIHEVGTFTMDVHFNVDYRPFFSTLNKSKDISRNTFTIAEALFGVKDYKERQTFSVLSHSLSGLKSIYDQTFKQDLDNLTTEAEPIMKAYSEEDISSLCTLDYEFDFYLAAVKFIEFWSETGIKMCLPVVRKLDENICYANDVIDLGLALRMKNNKEDLQNIVANNVEFNDEARIYILTGANRGGKTTYVRSVGITYMLFQNGLYVSGCYSQMSPVNNIFVHFPKEEAKIYGQGHLSEELVELKKILVKARNADLILLNESLSSTGLKDSLVICKDYLQILSELGVKCIFATHLHPLAEQCDYLNRNESVISRVDSLVATVKEEIINGVMTRKRTYRIERRMTDGESYADEIARQHGLSYEQIISGRNPLQNTVINNKYFSLLYKDSYTEMELSDKTIRDIGLDKLTNLVSEFNTDYRSFLQRLAKIPADIENVSYRQDIFHELMTNKKLADETMQFVDDAAKLEKRMHDKYNELPDHRRKLRWKLSALEQYVHCIESLCTLLDKNDIRSEGLKKLYDLIKEHRNQAEYINLIELIPNMEKEIRRMRNIQIRVKFDSKLQPDKIELQNIGHLQVPKAAQKPHSDFETVKVIAPGHKPVSKTKQFFRRLYSLMFEEQWITRIMSIKSTTKGNMEIMFLNEVQRYINECLNRFAEGIDTYLAEHGRRIINIASELYYYTNGYRLVNTLIKSGIPMCKPNLSKNNTCIIRGLCDMTTGLLLYNEEKMNELVTNTIDFSDNKCIFILTGPNQGGKTTFIRGLGIAQVFFQGGLYVPAEEAEMSPVNKLRTHFLKNEEKSLGEGRLGEELKRLSEILYSVSENDMLLMNESISCTTAYDGFIIGKNIVKALCDIGTKVVYSTHLHELSDAVDDMNSETNSENRVVPLTAGVEKVSSNGEVEYVRTYKVTEGKTDGKSYAGDIAKQHGMTYELMKEMLKN